MITVSICCLAYNHENFITQCLDGFLSQKINFEIEILIHDDASTDRTAEIIREYEAKYPNIVKPIYQIINQFSQGIKPTIKHQFPRAKGKYIALCEGDDYWTDPLKLQKQVDFMEGNLDYSGCFHNTDMIDENNSASVLKSWRSYEKKIFLLEDTISTTALFHTSSFLFRAEFLELPKWFLKVQSADMALFSIIASKGPLYRIDATMSIYRKNIGGITTDLTLTNYHENRIKLFQNLKTYCTQLVYTKINEVVMYHRLELRKLKKQALKARIKNFLKL